jgi:hypothetical protein
MMARGDLPQLQRTPDIKYCRLFSHSCLATQLLHHFPFKFGNSSLFFLFSLCTPARSSFISSSSSSLFSQMERRKGKGKGKEKSRRSKKKKKKRREEEEKIREYLVFFPAGFEILMFYLLMGLGF